MKGIPVDMKKKKVNSKEDKKTPGKPVRTNSVKKKSLPSTPSSNKITNYVIKRGAQEQVTGSMNTQEDRQKNRVTVMNDMNDRNDRKTAGIDTVMNSEKTENIAKLTFTTPAKKTVSKKIIDFQKLARGGECVLGSGRCGFHNCKLVRSVNYKKMSVINKDGSIGWTRREVTILACPYNTPSSDVTADSGSQGRDKSTNKKARITSDQPQSSTQ